MLSVGYALLDYGVLDVHRVSDGSRVFSMATFSMFWSGMAFSPDGSELAMVNSGGIRIFRTSNWSQRLAVGLSADSLAYSPDGRSLLFAGQTFVNNGMLYGFEAKLARTNDGMVEQVFGGHSNHVSTAAFTSQGRSVLTASHDNSIRLWRVANGKTLRVWDEETSGVERALAVSPTGRYFAYGRADGVLVLARVPVFISQFRQQGDQWSLQWEDGSGLYQLQQCTNLTNDAWQDVGGPTTATSASNPVSGTLFYRVQSLPNP